MTKTKTGPLASHGLCAEVAKDFVPYTMTLMAGADAMAQGKVWWPFKWRARLSLSLNCPRSGSGQCCWSG